MSTSKNMLDGLPDELVEMIFRKLPLWELKTLAKVDKRSRRLVHDLKPKIYVISSYDVEICITESNLLIGDVNDGIRCDKDSKKRFFKLFLELVSNFKNVRIIQGSYLINFSAMKIGHGYKGWKQLASIIPNIESLFGQHLGEHGLNFSSGLSQVMFAFIRQALLEDPTSNPCSKDTIAIEGITYGMGAVDLIIDQFLDRHPQLTFKFSANNDKYFHSYLKIDNFTTRLTKLQLGIDKFMEPKICFPNVDLFKTDGRIDLETFPTKLNAILPNLRKLIISPHNVHAVNNIWHVCEHNNNITDLQTGIMSDYVPPIKQLDKIMSRNDRKLEYVMFTKYHKSEKSKVVLHIIRKNLKHELILKPGTPMADFRGFKNMIFETKNLVLAIETDEDNHDRPWWCAIRDMFINMPDFGFDKLTQDKVQQVTQRWILENV